MVEKAKSKDTVVSAETNIDMDADLPQRSEEARYTIICHIFPHS